MTDPAHGAVLARHRNADLRTLAWRADWIRLRTIELVEIAGSGHYSSVFSCAEILAALYYKVLRLKPSQPRWEDRDRFLLGKGHAAIGVYPCLADLGMFPREWLASYTRLGSPLGDHPDMTKVPGIDFSSGSIGHNLSVGTGAALAAKLRRRDWLTYVLLGDGELNEGQVWEAAMSAAHYRLDNLVAIVDANGMGLDGNIEDVMNIEPIAAKFESFGWAAHEIDGHDLAQVVQALEAAPVAGRPRVIVARTVKGKGVKFMEETPWWHLGYLGAADKEVAIREIRARMGEP
ncbi:MAG: transketolase [Gammaproteobacteria bacterium]